MSARHGGLSGTLRALLSAAMISAAGYGAIATTDAAAQKWPERPLRIIVPFVPGAGADFTGRLVAQRLTEALGQQVIVDNRPGAGSVTGNALAAKAAADGYTLLVGTAAFTYIPGLYPKVGYDTLKDFAGVSLISTAPFLLVVRPSAPAVTVEDLIKLARAKPGEVLYGSAGQGSAVHLAAALFASVTKTQLTQVPYKGGGQAVTGLLGGEVTMMFATPETLLQFVRDNRMRALVVTSRERTPVLPNVPTMIETGFPDYEHSAWFGVLAPAKTPKDIVERISAEIAKGLAGAETRERFAQQGSKLIANTPREFDRFLRDEVVKWTRVIREAGIKLD